MPLFRGLLGPAEGDALVLRESQVDRRVRGMAQGVDVLRLLIPGFGEFEQYGRLRVRIEGVEVTREELVGKLGDRYLPLVGEVNRQDDGEHDPEEGGAERV